MTMAEMLAKPAHLSVEEYEITLNLKKKIEREISSVSDKLQAEEDSLEVLADEVGSERYLRHSQREHDLKMRLFTLQHRLTGIQNKLNSKQEG